MPRLAKIVVEGVAHHIVQRGNNRQDVFFVDDDRELTDMLQWARIMVPADWRRLLSRPPAKAQVTALRQSTHRGWQNCRHNSVRR